jgi:hypothetical protein
MKITTKVIGLLMMLVAIVFVIFALNHPEMSFPWSNNITYTLYGVYALVTLILLIIPRKKK